MDSEDISSSSYLILLSKLYTLFGIDQRHSVGFEQELIINSLENLINDKTELEQRVREAEHKIVYLEEEIKVLKSNEKSHLEEEHHSFTNKESLYKENLASNNVDISREKIVETDAKLHEYNEDANYQQDHQHDEKEDDKLVRDTERFNENEKPNLQAEYSSRDSEEIIYSEKYSEGERDSQMFNNASDDNEDLENVNLTLSNIKKELSDNTRAHNKIIRDKIKEISSKLKEELHCIELCLIK